MKNMPTGVLALIGITIIAAIGVVTTTLLELGRSAASPYAAIADDIGTFYGSERFRKLPEDSQIQYRNMIEKLEFPGAILRKGWSTELRSLSDSRSEVIMVCFERNLKQIFDEGRLDRFRACGRYYQDKLANPDAIYFIRSAVDDSLTNIRSSLPDLARSHIVTAAVPLLVGVILFALAMAFSTQLTKALALAGMVIGVVAVVLASLGASAELRAAAEALTRLHNFKVQVDTTAILYAEQPTGDELATVPTEEVKALLVRFTTIIDDYAARAPAGRVAPNFGALVPKLSF